MSRRDSAEQTSKPVSRSGTPDPRFGASNGGDAPMPLYHKPRGKREGLIYRLVALLLQLRLSSTSVVLSVLAILLVSLALVGRRGTDASLDYGDNLMAGSEGIEVIPIVAGDAGDAGGVTWMEVERLARDGARAQDRFGFGSLKGAHGGDGGSGESGGNGGNGGNGGSENVETLATSGEKGTSDKGETGEVVGSSGISAVDSIDLVDFKNLVVHAATDLPDFILLLLRPLAPLGSSKSDVAAGYTADDVVAAAGNRSSEGASSGIVRNARFGRARVSQQQLERIKEMQCRFVKGPLTARTRVLQVSADGLDAVGDVGDLSDVRDVGDERSSSSGSGSNSSSSSSSSSSRGAERATGGSNRRRLATVGVSQEQRGDTGVGVQGAAGEKAGGNESREEGRRGMGDGQVGGMGGGQVGEVITGVIYTNPHLPPVLANVTCVFGADGGTGGAGSSGGTGGTGGAGAGGTGGAGGAGAGGSGGEEERGSEGGSGSEGAEQVGVLRVPALAAAMEVVFCPLPASVGAYAVEYEGRLFPSVALFDPVDPFDQPEAPHGQLEGDEGSNGQHSSDGSQNGGSDSDSWRTGAGLNAGSAVNGSNTHVGTKQAAGVEAGEEAGVSMSQQAGFSHCVLRAARQCEWVGFIDVDEFVAPKFIAHIAEGRKGLEGEVREKGVFIPHLLRRVVRASEREIEEVLARKMGKKHGKGGLGGNDKGSRSSKKSKGDQATKKKGKGSEGDKSKGKQAKKSKQAKGEAEEEEDEKGEGMRKRGVEKKEKTKKRKKGTGDVDSKSLTSHPQQGVSVGYTCRARKPDRHKSFVRPEAVADSLLCHIHQFELREEKYRSQVFSGRVRLANINHFKFQVWDEFKAKYRRRVATYTKDWKGAKQNSNDLIPGLGTDAVEPPDWAGRFCERNDTVLRDFVKLAFAVKDGKGGDGRNRTCLAWE
ncbi:unnamed protein product [Closterium sp. Yama58-4]|nr:unnamed protein product [Closterium sp. Yama58-4]